MRKPNWRPALIRTLLFFGGVLAALMPALGQRDTIRSQVDLVVVPTSVRDANGKLVNGLRKEDFTILEDGKQQSIQQLSTDPAPLSTVVVVDTGMGGTGLRRFSSSIPALSSTFISDFDEAAVYRFGTSVSKVTDFTKDQKSFERTMGVIRDIAEKKGENNGDPLIIAPGHGPRWLRWILDRGNAPRPLNDALFTAASDLEKRPEENRKILVVVSDGQTAHSGVAVDQARDRLVKDKIQVYAVTVGIGILGGSVSELQSYAGSTGGDVYDGRSQTAMENAFASIGEQARYQYVLSYVSSNEVVGAESVVRKIEVKTTNPQLKINHRKTYVQYPTRK
jgi:Ca-activated chloride channel family protein